MVKEFNYYNQAQKTMVYMLFKVSYIETLFNKIIIGDIINKTIQI